ncbi:MAG TPA: hypothetical protein VFV99_23075 [Kofleriaceae bacterium]|nr:hypothetical protein [Kofleriaceae bacterium]
MRPTIMMRVVPAVAVTLGIAACVEPRRPGEPGDDASRVTLLELTETPRTKSDLLIVIDDTTAMAPVRSQLATLPARLADRLDWYTRRWIDLRVAVATNDGTLRRLPGVDTPWVADAFDFDYTRRRNYDGTLADALTALMDVGAANPSTSQPLEAARHALETGTELMRDNAGLMVLTISAADDASSLPVSDYVNWMWSVSNGQTWWRDVLLSGLYVQPASRLDEYYKAFPWSIITPLDSGNVEAAIPWVPEGSGNGGQSADSWVGLGCYELADLDAAIPGLDHECQMMVSINNEWRELPECTASQRIERTERERGLSGPPEACWWLRPNFESCLYTTGREIALSGYTGAQHPALRFDCRAR